MRLLAQFSLLALAAIAFGSSKIVEGKLEAAPETGDWTLRIGADAVPVAPEKRTRFWLHRAPADAKGFHAGDLVVARIAVDDSPAALREISDKESWTWLETIRKGVREGAVKAYDGKRLTVAFPDGSEMAYRATEKSKVSLDGKPAALADLKPGQKLWTKGRTLPSLDIWLVEASDHPIVVPPKKGAPKKAPGAKAARTKRLPASGRLEGEIFVHGAGMSLFDLTVDGVTMHVAFTSATAFTFGGLKCGPNELIAGRHASVAYKRDQYGRIMASKVDIR